MPAWKWQQIRDLEKSLATIWCKYSLLCTRVVGYKVEMLSNDGSCSGLYRTMQCKQWLVSFPWQTNELFRLFRHELLERLHYRRQSFPCALDWDMPGSTWWNNRKGSSWSCWWLMTNRQISMSVIRSICGMTAVRSLKNSTARVFIFKLMNDIDCKFRLARSIVFVRLLWAKKSFSGDVIQNTYTNEVLLHRI